MPAARRTKSSRTATKKAKAQQLVNCYPNASEVATHKPGKVCPLCGETLAGDLARHMKLHKEPEFKCPYEGCNHRCRQRSNLQAHFNTHTGNRPAKCPDIWIDENDMRTPCVACFRDGSSLTRHRQRYHAYDSHAKQCPEPSFKSAADQIDDKLVYHLCLAERLSVADAEKKLQRVKMEGELPKDLVAVVHEWCREHAGAPLPATVSAPVRAAFPTASLAGNVASSSSSSSFASSSTYVASSSASVAASSGWSSSLSSSPWSSPVASTSALPSSSGTEYFLEKMLADLSATAPYARPGTPFLDFLLPVPEPQQQQQPSFDLDIEEEVDYPPVRPAAPFPGRMRQPQQQQQQPQAFVFENVAQPGVYAPSQVPVQFEFDVAPKIELPSDGAFDFGFDFDFAAQLAPAPTPSPALAPAPTPSPAPAPAPASAPASLFGFDGQWGFDNDNNNNDFELFCNSVNAGFFGPDLALGLDLENATTTAATSGSAEAGSSESLIFELPPFGRMPALPPVPQPQAPPTQPPKGLDLPGWVSYFEPRSPSSSTSTAPSSPSANDIDELVAFY
ncbi:hypothetical protein C8Q78DRAFT_1156992 [Trametes maxima]|nr:hypothetical protein C8Q78DRAFT_1156992 [Trametes maxima]